MAARLRSKSESLSTPPHNITSSSHSSVTEDDSIDVTFISPLARQRQNITALTGADASSISAEPVSPKSKKGPALKHCQSPYKYCFSDVIVTQIEQSIKSSVTAQNAELLTSICSDLDKLSKGVTEFAKNSHGHETKGTERL